jgi:hypothetical protein
MSAAPQVHTPLVWYSVGDDRVVYEVVNRADHPLPGRAPIEFPSLQVVTYPGGGQWDSQRDWWSMRDMAAMRDRWLAAVAEAEDLAVGGSGGGGGHRDGAADAGGAGSGLGADPLSRADWRDWVVWARPEPGHRAAPSWVGSGIVAIRRLREMDFGIRN